MPTRFELLGLVPVEPNPLEASADSVLDEAFLAARTDLQTPTEKLLAKALLLLEKRVGKKPAPELPLHLQELMAGTLLGHFSSDEMVRIYRYAFGNAADLLHSARVQCSHCGGYTDFTPVDTEIAQHLATALFRRNGYDLYFAEWIKARPRRQAEIENFQTTYMALLAEELTPQTK